MNVSRWFCLTVLVLLLGSGCASTSATRLTYADPAYEDARYGNFLVIGVAGNYNNRAEFERSLVSDLRAAGAAASAYHVVKPGVDALSRNLILEAVAEGGFDAVLVTRVVDRQSEARMQSGTSQVKSTAIGGQAVNFFRYDYEELNEPESLVASTTATLSTELFAASDEKMVWSIEISESNVENAGVFINRSAASIVSRLDRSRLIGN